MFGKTMYVDCDNTLVFSCAEHPEFAGTLSVLSVGSRAFYVNQRLLDLMLDCNSRGIRIVLWSAGGEIWAGLVLNHLENAGYISEAAAAEMYTLGKPDFLFDDKDPIDYLPRREYVGPVPSPQTDKLILTIPDVMQAIRASTIGGYSIDIKDLEERLAEANERNK